MDCDSLFASGLRSALAPAAAAVSLAVSASLWAATLEVTVRDAAGAPVEDAVVSLVRAGGPAGPGTAAPKPPTAPTMDQRNQQYVPYVLPVRTGTTVKFPQQRQHPAQRLFVLAGQDL